jgi:hypothetical protein
MASVGLGAPDALTRCHDALAALFEARYWQKAWQALESVTSPWQSPVASRKQPSSSAVSMFSQAV